MISSPTESELKGIKRIERKLKEWAIALGIDASTRRKWYRIYAVLVAYLKCMTFPLDYLRYLYAIAARKPYFGKIMRANQTAGARGLHMRKMIEQLSSGKDLKILEVGSWAGNSARFWIGCVDEFNHGAGTVFCVDQWRSYFKNIDSPMPTYSIMERAFHRDAILKLFIHNTTSDQRIRFARGKSSEILPLLAPGLFDLAYIDADHSYAPTLRDLQLASPLLRTGGILCGDDLELQYPDAQNIDEYRNKECDMDEAQTCHAGVTLAVWDFFKTRVSEGHGFWAMRKTETGWEQVDIG